MNNSEVRREISKQNDCLITGDTVVKGRNVPATIPNAGFLTSAAVSTAVKVTSGALVIVRASEFAQIGDSKELAMIGGWMSFTTTLRFCHR